MRSEIVSKVGARMLTEVISIGKPKYCRRTVSTGPYGLYRELEGRFLGKNGFKKTNYKLETFPENLKKSNREDSFEMEQEQTLRGLVKNVWTATQKRFVKGPSTKTKL